MLILIFPHINSFLKFQALLNYEEIRDSINVSDRYDNDPLHISAMKGYLPIVRVSIKGNYLAGDKNSTRPLVIMHEIYKRTSNSSQSTHPVGRTG